MVKGYYLTYEVISENMSEIVDFLEKTLNVQLTTENVDEDEELYILSKCLGDFPIIDVCSIQKIYNRSSDIENSPFPKLRYFVACNIITGDEDLKKKSMEYIKEEFSKYKNIREWQYDESEWEWLTM